MVAGSRLRPCFSVRRHMTRCFCIALLFCLHAPPLPPPTPPTPSCQKKKSASLCADGTSLNIHQTHLHCHVINKVIQPKSTKGKKKKRVIIQMIRLHTFMFGEEAGKKNISGNFFFFGLPLIFYKTETAFPTNDSSHLFFWIKLTKEKKLIQTNPRPQLNESRLFHPIIAPFFLTDCTQLELKEKAARGQRFTLRLLLLFKTSGLRFVCIIREGGWFKQ